MTSITASALQSLALCHPLKNIEGLTLLEAPHQSLRVQKASLTTDRLLCRLLHGVHAYLPGEQLHRLNRDQRRFCVCHLRHLGLFIQGTFLAVLLPALSSNQWELR